MDHGQTYEFDHQNDGQTHRHDAGVDVNSDEDELDNVNLSEFQKSSVHLSAYICIYIYMYLYIYMYIYIYMNS